MKAVCRGVRYLGTSTDDVCVDEPSGNLEQVVTGHGAGHGVGHGAGYGAGHGVGAGGGRGGGGVARGGGGGSEQAVVRGSSRPTLSVHDKSRSRDAAPPTGGSRGYVERECALESNLSLRSPNYRTQSTTFLVFKHQKFVPTQITTSDYSYC